MKTKDFAEQVENLPKEQKMAILGIIDLKVDNDMEKVLQRIDSMNAEMKAEMRTMENKISVLYWLIGALAVLMSIYRFLGE
ncbi:hypothetical protein [Flagellimonas sp.]|uniref:hypothetical protein n=1 Tax=Flagellimonas sp. TaxID=2058762 RepID=UPI003BAAD503